MSPGTERGDVRGSPDPDLQCRGLHPHSPSFWKEDYGHQEVNLNLGCPSGTVTAKGKGAGFLAEPQKLDAFLDESL
ncbi:MAG: tRNA-dihydrouridine synthase [Ruminococcus sp.]